LGILVPTDEEGRVRMRGSGAQRFCLVLAAVLATLSLGLGQATAQEAGTWQGQVDQPGSEPYSIVMELDGQGGGRTDYPELNCGGVLSGGPGVYQETIDRNRASGESGGCIDGQISVTVSGDTMQWSWSGEWQGQPYTAQAVLTRIGGSADEICDTCGRALQSDVSFGVSSSAMLRTYVQQSSGKYENCARRHANACVDSCWRTNLASLLPICERFDDNGHRACVEEALSSAGQCQNQSQ
jgi:hypothetical protein